MDEIDREVQYLESLEKLPVTEDTKWLMQYIRNTNSMLAKTNDWLRGIFFVLLAILAVLATVHWDSLTAIW